MPATKARLKAPRLAPSEDTTFRCFVRTFGLAERVMQAHFARFGISGAQWGVLRNLYRAEHERRGGLRLTDLSERLLIRPPSVTGVVDRLERAGLVLRGDSATDLRVKHVALTPKGRHLVEHVLEFHQAQIDKVLSGLNEHEQAELHRLLGRLGHHLERLLEEGITTTIG